MTDEEAIKWLKTFKGNTGMAELSQAFDVAIKALEQQNVLFKMGLLKDCESCKARSINFMGEEEAEEFKEYLKNQQPCEDFISRQAAIDCLNADFTIDGKENMETVVDYINGAFKQIKALPSITPQQKVGKWIAVENEEMETIGYYCSECDLPMKTEYRTKFCPNCGCRMKGEDK